MTAVLVESFFIDNPEDKRIGDTVVEQTVFGIAYAKAIIEYLGLEYKSKKAVYRVQVGAYNSEENARKMKKTLDSEGFETIIVKG